MKLKKGDTIKIIAGKYKNETDVIKKINKKSNRIMLESTIKHKKHVKPNNLHPEGGITEINGTIHISNVMLLDNKKSAKKEGKTKVVTRVGYKFVDGKKVRYAKKSGREL